MKKAVFLDVVESVVSIAFFILIAVVMMIVYIITFRRKDDSLLPG